MLVLHHRQRPARPLPPLPLYFALLLLVTCAAHAATLSGTVHYSGGLAGVSSTHPIKLLLSSDPNFDGDNVIVAQTTVPINGGAFTLEAPAAGTYYLAFALALISEQFDRFHVGEPYQIFDTRFSFPGDPIDVPQQFVILDFDDSAQLSGIAGNAQYTGTRTTISVDHPIIVELFADAQLTQPVGNKHVAINGDRYDQITFDNNTYYVRAFADLNGNSQLDAGEPSQIYFGRNRVPADPVVAGPQQTSVDFIISDPAACPGDCDGDGMVTVSELVRGVGIILGSAAVDACTALDTNRDGSVIIGELIAAVGALLQGCPT